MKKGILILNVISLLISCNAKNTDNCHMIITVVNKTDKTIYVANSDGYPETDFTKLIGNPLKFPTSHKVESNESSRGAVLKSYGTCYEYIYKNSIPSDTMLVYVFDGPTLENKGWDYIKKNNLVLKRYELTLKDLDSLNWTITYDGK